MQKTIVLLFKGLRLIKWKLLKSFDWLMGFYVFYTNGIKFSSFKNSGWPRVMVSRGGICLIGEKFRSNNREMSNPIGRFNKCSLFVGNKGTLVIGENVGMSSSAIVCHDFIEIGDNVLLGGNVCIYDTDFHSLNSSERTASLSDKKGTISKKVSIGNHVFIGAHSTILKGVTIGKNSIIGACSLVAKNIPANEIWAGNPAKFIKKTV